MSRPFRVAYFVTIALIPLGFVAIVERLGAPADWRGAMICTALLLGVGTYCEWKCQQIDRHQA